MQLDEILTEEFVVFSKKIAELVERKTLLKADFTKAYNAMNEEAKRLHAEFEAWRAEFAKKKAGTPA